MMQQAGRNGQLPTSHEESASVKKKDVDPTFVIKLPHLSQDIGPDLVNETPLIRVRGAV